MENQPSMNNRFLAMINQIIEENLADEHFSVEDLAKNSGLSRSMLHRKLIKLTGKSATDLITEKRLLQAKDLLENNVATASEIAYRVGFNSPSYFNKVFKKHFNVSPGDFRKGAVVHTDQPSEDQKPEDQIPSHHKFFGLNSKVLIISLAIIVAGIGVYYVIIRSRSAEESIAVLPIENLTGQSENEFFVEGVHEALISELGHIGTLRVISRRSTLRYQDSKMLLKDIANELGVKNIVEGSVHCAGDSLCFLIQLIDVLPKERLILTNEYYDDMQNILAVHSSAVEDIAQKIKIRLTKEEEQRLAKPRTVDPETYRAYLRGMHYLHQGTKEGFETGINYLQEAIDRDPGDPFAYAALALGYAIRGHGQLTPQEAFLRATSAANKAIKLDPNIDEAYTALAMIYVYEAWDWPKAKKAFENAIAKNPSNGIAHAHFAWYHILFNDIEKSLYHAKRAVLIEPFTPSYNAWLALLCWYNKDFTESEYYAKKALSLKENAPYGILALGWICLHNKQYQKAIEYCDRLPEYNYYWKMMRGYIYTKAGEREKALDYYKDMDEYAKDHWISKCELGYMAAYLGFTDKAFELFNEAAVEQKLYPLNYIGFYPMAEDLRNDPRYDELLQKMNLPTQKLLLTSN